jgi:4-alpha-glucanotransferase
VSTDDQRPAPSADAPGGDPSPALAALAASLGVATEFHDWQGGHRSVPAHTIRSVLAAMNIDASTEEAVARAAADVELRPWRRALPPVVVVRAGDDVTVPLHLSSGDSATLAVRLEDGGSRDDVTQRAGATRDVDGRQVVEVGCALPRDLPLGWHLLEARSASGLEASCPLVVTPAQVGLPAHLHERSAWGFMAQLYSVRSQRSWGLGDLGDLGGLLEWSGRDLGADFLLVNPLHAAEPVPPMEPSPYLPTTRRFANPVYLRVEDVPEYADLTPQAREQVDALAAAERAHNTDDTIDRNSSWTAKRAALDLLFAVPRSPERQAAFDAFRAQEGAGLVDFATWCALTQEYGPAWRVWPQELQDPHSAAVERAREKLADQVELHAWLQWLLDEQLAAVQQRALDAGMRVGVVHDLAVGVHPGGADSWALQDVLALGVSVGAPPDAFNQQGQDWSQPPWRPDALAECAYAPYRDMLRTILRHAGGIRIDHVIGLFRLWWVPKESRPVEGTYVYYDSEALIGILALEAHRAGCFVVGEDLGVVQPSARTYLRERGICGTSILWWERQWDTPGQPPLPPQEWRELCLATVTTHDLPPTAGYLAGEHIRIRDELGLLTRTVAQEQADDDEEKATMLGALREQGVLGPDAGEEETVEALHRFLALTSSRLLGVALADAAGDRRAINQPGTSDEYPNWRVPLADGSGRPLLLEELVTSERARVLAAAVSGQPRRTPAGAPS